VAEGKTSEMSSKAKESVKEIANALPTDAALLARFQQQQVDDVYQNGTGSFLADLAKLKDIQE